MALFLGGGNVYSADGLTLKLTSGQFSVIGTKRKTRATDLPGINGTQSSGLGIALPLVSQVYDFEGVLWVTGAATTPQNFQIHALSAGATLNFVFSANSIGAAGTAFTSFPTTNPVTAVTTNFAGSAGASVPATGLVIVFYGSITVGSTLTTLQIDQVDTGTTNTLKAGSWLGAEFSV